LVVKQVSGGLVREADVYRALWRHLRNPPAVKLLGYEASGNVTYMYLEHATSATPWPWNDTAATALVCVELARLHDSTSLPRDAFSWNYDDELRRSADETLAFAAVARDADGRLIWRRPGDLRRVVTALPHIRRRLLSGGGTIIHGDVHSGNVLLRRNATGSDVVLIDWARARLGSPLEDIASWLHSLGCWEPQARKRHDTLMRAYLEARQVPLRFDADLRLAYCLASSSNGLSGAIRYHLAMVGAATTTASARANSALALRAWQRVIRQAAAIIRTNPDC
jgi:aminoglycoside phosphotransferase (APT) family kinase protein